MMMTSCGLRPLFGAKKPLFAKPAQSRMKVSIKCHIFISTASGTVCYDLR